MLRSISQNLEKEFIESLTWSFRQHRVEVNSSELLVILEEVLDNYAIV